MVSKEWRTSERDALINFARNAVTPLGFGYLDANGQHQVNHGLELWINGRFTHVMACEVIRGNESARELLDLGMRALTTSLRDPQYDGWYKSVHPDKTDELGHGVPFTANDTVKEAYSHAFVILAAAGAMQAGHPQAAQLFKDAHHLLNKYWWETPVGRVRESASRDWTNFENYRGINANMHTTECLLASYDATGEVEYLQRALEILRFVMQGASKKNWRIHEHYTVAWQADETYNQDKPADPFRPWGATVGHGFEWARLGLQAAVMAMRIGLVEVNGPEQDWIITAPLELIKQAIQDGWAVDGEPGFVYTTDFAGNPITHERMHWVVCEAINAVYVARQVLCDYPSLAGKYPDLAKQIADYENTWWQYIKHYVLVAPGRWREELDRHNQLSELTWTGMPEIYHAYQTIVLADGDYAVGFAKAASTQI